MNKLNVPSQSVLIYRDKLIKSVQELYETSNSLADKIVAEYESMFYEGVYLGVDADYTDILNPEHFHELIARGKAVNFDTVSGYIWVVAPADETIVVAMSLVEVPMELNSTVDIDGESYKVWKSQEEQTGSFNLYLF